MLEQNIRVLFGLKIHQLRKDKGLSLKELSEKTGLSVSYINEIENGKKYPKQEKILTLAKSLDVKYDQLVAIHSNKMLEPLTQIMESDVFNEIPFETFGISRETIFHLFSQAPAKITAFFNVFLEIADSYHLESNDLYYSVLRSYQELHLNYFEDIEAKAMEFMHEMNVTDIQQPKVLKNILTKLYSYNIEVSELNEFEDLRHFRSILVRETTTPILFINKKLDKSQRTFIYAKELGFKSLGLEIRPLTSSWYEVDSFTMVLNNFLASYFAGAVLIPKDRLEADINSIFKKSKWSNERFLNTIKSYFVSTETFFQRCTNLLMNTGFVDKLFFIRYDIKNQKEYQITKELQLSKDTIHYTQRTKEKKFYQWISYKNLQYFLKLKRENQESPMDLTQITKSIQDDTTIFCISFQRDKIFLEGGEYLSLGFEVKNSDLDNIHFHLDKSIYTLTTSQDYELELLNENQKKEIFKTEQIKKSLFDFSQSKLNQEK